MKADPRPLAFRRPTPREAGYRWPAEWERHAATFLAWPHDPTTWGEDRDAVEKVYARFAAALGRGETVHILVDDARMERQARARLDEAGARRATLHRVRTADAWIRDYGPIVVARGRGKTRERLALDFHFNAWGDKYASLLPDDRIPRRLARVHGLPTKRVDLVLEGGSIDGNGRGTILTTEQCLLHPNRNPHLVKEEIEAHLREYLGARHVLWLGKGIAGDDTDGHIDDMTRFVGPHTVVTAVEEDEKDENHAPLRDNLRRLRAMADQDGHPLDVVELPMPEAVFDADGARLPASYANFMIANKVVAMPVFGGKRDARAYAILKRLFPRRDVIPIPARRLVEGFGTLHCLSLQLPA